MYMEVSREEWVFRGLAIATILLVGMIVLPAVSTSKLGIYLAMKEHDNRCAGAGMLAGASMAHGGWSLAHVAFEMGIYFAGEEAAATVALGAMCLGAGLVAVGVAIAF